MDLNKVIFFVHLPKNGGSSVRACLSHVHGEGHFSEVSLLNHIPYSKKDCEHISYKNANWLKAYSSHKINFENLDGITNALAFTVLRDPVERFISRYFYFRKSIIANSAARTMSIEEFFDHELIQHHCLPQTNSQVYHLSNGRGLIWLMECIKRNNFKIFTHPTQTKDYIGYPLDFPHINASEREPVSDSLKQKINDLSQEDRNLYDIFSVNNG